MTEHPRSWRPWGDHPVVVSLIVLSALAGIGTSIRAFVSSDRSPGPLGAGEIPDAAVMVAESVVHVPANEYWYDSGISVEKNDWLALEAEGTWWSGIASTDASGAQGLFGFGRPACGACPIPEGNLGELVGRVGDGPAFRIGRSSVHAVDRSGTLVLAMNENTRPCREGEPGSCYDDNNGSLHVRVTVRRIE